MDTTDNLELKDSRPGTSETDEEIEVVRGIQEALGERYGGMWLEKGEVSVAVVGATDHDTESLAALTPRDSVVNVYSARYSYRDLVAFTEVASGAAGKANVAYTSIGPDHLTGTVQAHVSSAEAADAIKKVLSSALPSDAFSIVVEQGGWFAAEAREEFPPFEGDGLSTFHPPTSVVVLG